MRKSSVRTLKRSDGSSFRISDQHQLVRPVQDVGKGMFLATIAV
jgi:hypothetical protein